MNLLNRIAMYFKEWDGSEETAPKMELDISELRYIASLNVERCKLEAENKSLKNIRIPMKPIEYEDKYYACKCGNVLMMKWEKYNKKLNPKGEGLPYCLSCGQAIDWT